MTMNLPVLARSTSLVIRQQKEWGEILTNWDSKNRYAIGDGGDTPMLYAGEVSSGIGGFLARGFLKNNRPFTIEVRDAMGQVQLVIRRPFTFFFSRIEIADAMGQHIGTVRQRFAFFARRFTVEDASGNEVATLHGPFFKPWTFRVLVGDAEVGVIRKKWSGLGREMFTAADTFGLELGATMGPELRPLCLAATFLVDFVYFENHG
jgi:uncharacterized protein YxjI